MNNEKVYFSEIAEILFEQEHPAIRQEISEVYYLEKKGEWKKDLQKKHWNKILQGLGLQNDSFNQKLRDSKQHNQYFFPAESKDFIIRLLSKPYRNKFHRLISGSKFPFTLDEVLEFTYGFYDLHISLGYTQEETAANMKKLLELIHFQEHWQAVEQLYNMGTPLVALVGNQPEK